MPFKLRLSVSNLHTNDATAVLARFISSVKAKYSVAVDEMPAGTADMAGATISIPFADRESLRIDYNIFAAEFEVEHPEEENPYFKLESA
jgi:hypothetical protein